MRENRTYGSEGGGEVALPYPYHRWANCFGLLPHWWSKRVGLLVWNWCPVPLWTTKTVSCVVRLIVQKQGYCVLSR